MNRLFAALLLPLIILFSTTTAYAQDAAQLTISNSDISQIPTVRLTAFGQDGEGNPINFNSEMVSVRHGSEAISSVQVVGTDPQGTFTIFLLDLPPGVSGQLTQVQDVIQTFASTDYMMEQVDTLAIYRVDEINAIELQASTVFYNEVINRFTEGLETHSGPTALYDSVGDLLTRIDSLRPSPSTVSSIVIMSDGTDAVSTQFTSEQLAPLAREKGVHIHTVVLDNENLTFAREAGAEFLAELATSTGGRPADLNNVGSVENIWSNIIAFRDHAILEYTVSALAAGPTSIELLLPNSPNIPAASTSVNIPATLPSIQIVLPPEPEARTISWPDAESAIPLTIPTSINWLDDQERAITTAQLWVNGTAVQEIEPAGLANVATELVLPPGTHAIQVLMVDELGQQARSQEVVLTVVEGERAVPEALGSLSSFPWRILIYALVCLFILGLLFLLWGRLRSGRSADGDGASPLDSIRDRMRSTTDRKSDTGARPPVPAKRESTPSRPKPSTASASAKVESPTLGMGAIKSTPAASGPPSMNNQPWLEILESLTRMPNSATLGRSEFLIGRSPTVDLAFTDDPTVSRIHSTIVQDNKIYRIYDEQSTSGTYVNDRKVPEYGLQLADGDEIHIGAVHLRFRQPA